MLTINKLLTMFSSCLKHCIEISDIKKEIKVVTQHICSNKLMGPTVFQLPPFEESIIIRGEWGNHG